MSSKKRLRAFSTFVLAVGLAGEAARADTVTIGAMKDNTLYQSPTGMLSNGKGSGIFVGRTAQFSNFRRRGLIAFDVADAVPAGSTIEKVVLKLTVGKTVAGAVNVGLHRLTADWGEGASNAGSDGGDGALAAAGDATWLHRFFPGELWAAEGGDFSATASGSATVGGLGPYEWQSTAAMVAEVQSWLDDPATNFGWLLLGVETQAPTAKLFTSREGNAQGSRPSLVIEFTPPPRVPVLSSWGGLVLGLFLLAGASWVLSRRQRQFDREESVTERRAASPS